MTEPTDQASEATARLDVAMERCNQADEQLSRAFAEWREAGKEFGEALRERHEAIGVFNRAQRRRQGLNTPNRHAARSKEMAELIAVSYVIHAEKFMEFAR